MNENDSCRMQKLYCDGHFPRQFSRQITPKSPTTRHSSQAFRIGQSAGCSKGRDETQVRPIRTLLEKVICDDKKVPSARVIKGTAEPVDLLKNVLVCDVVDDSSADEAFRVYKATQAWKLFSWALVLSKPDRGRT